MLTDGKGIFYKAIITLAHHKRCGVKIVEEIQALSPCPIKIHIAIAPTKNMDRIEWFAEKCTEIGINAITLLRCRFSERKEVKTERIEKILVSAMKQSIKATLPQLNGMTTFKEFVTRPFEGQKFIAHCYEKSDKILLKQRYIPGNNALILIGPEGDFQPGRGRTCNRKRIFTHITGEQPFTHRNSRNCRLSYNTCYQSIIKFYFQ